MNHVATSGKPQVPEHPCTSDKYRQCLAFVTTLLSCFAAGIVIGDVYEDMARAAKFVSLASTVIVYVLGMGVLRVSVSKQCYLTGAAMLFIMATSTANLFELFSLPVIDIMYNATSVAVVYLLHRWANGHCAATSCGA